MTKRYRVLAVVLILSLLLLDVRIFYIGFTKVQNTATSQHTATESYGTDRGLIFDRNMKKLVEYASRKVTSISNHSFSLAVPMRYDDAPLCAHLIGYTDAQNNGVCGIEKDYNDFLKAIPNHINLSTFKDARGNLLIGKGTRIDRSKQCTDSGIMLTIDRDIQLIAEEAGQTLHQGAVIVMNAATGELLASVSYPTFNPNALEEYIADTANQPMLNRAFTRFNVGSVFKVVVCLAALEAGVSEKTCFSCAGKIHCGGVTFSCHKKEGHGKINMTQAVAFSCNTYFIQLAQKIGYYKIYEICKRLGIEKSIPLSASLSAQAGTLPDSADMSAAAALANLSFGQGALLSSPLWLCKLYSAILNGGYSVEPQLLLGKMMSGDIKNLFSVQEKRVFSKQHADALYRMLCCAVSSGTGIAASTDKCAVAGKTATAQTGFYTGKKEKLISYFIGLFSIKGEQFTVLVMCENGTSGSKDCAPVFKEICEGIYDLKNIISK
ncbi:MAG: penicillin-binding protein 2 [Clostridia bacterium]|nr:penicillin-binding protein 2 [Clostridia bacterium]